MLQRQRPEALEGPGREYTRWCVDRLTAIAPHPSVYRKGRLPALSRDGEKVQDEGEERPDRAPVLRRNSEYRLRVLDNPADGGHEFRR